MLLKMREDSQRRGLCRLINRLRASYDNSKLFTMAEIGCYAGESTALFLRIPNLKIYCVDPWQNGYDVNDSASSSDLAQAERQFDLLQSMSIVKFKMKSSEAAPLVPEPLDFVYIDGLHTYEGVKEDLANWAPKIRAGCFIGGHDYRLTRSWAGLKKAVDEFANGRTIIRFIDSSWLIQL